MKYLLILLLFTGCSILEGAASKYRFEVEGKGDFKAGVIGLVKYVGVDGREGTGAARVLEDDGTVVWEATVDKTEKKSWKRNGKKFEPINWAVFITEWKLPW